MKALLKSAGMAIVGSSLITTCARALFCKQPLVILFHGVTDKENQEGIDNYRGKHVHAKEFEERIIWLKSRFNIVSLSVIEDSIVNKKPLGKNFCALTFDDGFEDNYRVAYPILKKHGLPATIFITTDFIQKKSFLWTDRLEFMMGRSTANSIKVEFPEGMTTYNISSRNQRIQADMEIRQKLKTYDTGIRERILDSISRQTGQSLSFENARDTDFMPLSWEQMKEMQSYGITIGGHTASHPILSKLTKSQQEVELRSSTELISKNLGSCRHVAYPNGQNTDWNRETEDVLKNLGFTCAWATLPRRVRIDDSPFALPRVTLDHSRFGMSRFRALVSNVLYSIKLAFNINL